MVFRESLRDDGAGAAEARDGRVGAAAVALLDACGERRGDALDADARAECLRLVVSHGGHIRDPGCARDGRPDLGRDGVEAALGRDDVVGLDRFLVRASTRCAEAAGHCRNQRDEGEPDHQRGGRGGGARGVAR